MIRGSIFIAVVAVLVSLLLHFMGLAFTTPNLVQDAGTSDAQDTVELGNSFEDLAEPASAPEEPEPVPEPEPPAEEEVVEELPEEPEVPVSEALVASENPQQTFSPDVGEAEVVQPVETEPVEPDVAETEDTSEGEEAASDEIEETPSVETAEVVEIPEGDPDVLPEELEAPTETPPVTPEVEELAALPEPEAEPVPEISVVPVVPLEDEAVDPVLPEATAEPEETEADSELAVRSSIRPQRPEREPTPRRQGASNGARDFSDLRFPSQEIESPLSTYRRSGVDNFTRGNSGTRSGGRGPGNSDTTNYAGEVLVHLNRAPVVFVSARGFAQVFFRINPDGSLAFVDVVDSSGSPEVDRAARAQVRAAEPFPLPPGGTSRSLSFFYTSN
ncbi:TonB family protein [Ruegeria lacuscaerulensis]|uniref:TonB family protein n=1 Tax=Ruegeria lacuscaerulensis TaxID=55218 RepID=UPI00147B94D2|nr:TonB family protein [Ruegeria lacuscaerulensis]